MNGHIEVLDRLLAAGLGVRDLSGMGACVFRLACKNKGHVAVLDRLLAAGMGVEDLRFAWRTACEDGHVEVLNLLLSAGLEDLRTVSPGGTWQGSACMP